MWLQRRKVQHVYLWKACIGSRMASWHVNTIATDLRDISPLVSKCVVTVSNHRWWFDLELCSSMKVDTARPKQFVSKQNAHTVDANLFCDLVHASLRWHRDSVLKPVDCDGSRGHWRTRLIRCSVISSDVSVKLQLKKFGTSSICIVRANSSAIVSSHLSGEEFLIALHAELASLN